MNHSGPPLHANELATDEHSVRRLLAAQFPKWEELRIESLGPLGTDNAIYRIGDDLAVRLPRTPSAAAQVEKEQRWIPKLAPHLTLQIPSPVASGVPSTDFPWRWSVVPWLAGTPANDGAIGDSRDAAKTLAKFTSELRAIDTTGGPVPGEHNFSRGVPLAERDKAVRIALTKLAGSVDVAAAARAWEVALAAPVYSGAPVWIHGDMTPRNLLAVDGRITAVLDFGGLAIADPACDLMVAWSLFDAEARALYRSELHADDATWARGRGWALSAALIALPYYSETHAGIARECRAILNQVLS